MRIEVPSGDQRWTTQADGAELSNVVHLSAESAIMDAVADGMIDTGLREDGVRLWVAADGTLIWLQYPDRVEQWTVLRSGCV